MVWLLIVVMLDSLNSVPTSNSLLIVIKLGHMHRIKTLKVKNTSKLKDLYQISYIIIKLFIYSIDKINMFGRQRSGVNFLSTVCLTQ